MEIIGIFLSIILLVIFAYRGYSILIIAPALSVFTIMLSAEPYALAGFTQVFMIATSKFVQNYFPLFLLSAIFGKLMEESGYAVIIARQIAKYFGVHNAILSVVIACSILTYGGVSLFVVVFAVYPIAYELFKQSGTAKNLIPASIALGAFTYTMSALPGTPSIQNIIPSKYFGTNIFAAPGIGICAAIVMFALGYWWLLYRRKCFTPGYDGVENAGDAGYDMAQVVSEKINSGKIVSKKKDISKKISGVNLDVKDKKVNLFDKNNLASEESFLENQNNLNKSHSKNHAKLDIKSANLDMNLNLDITNNFSKREIFCASLPIVLVLIVNFIMIYSIIPSLDTSYLSKPKYGPTDISAVANNWAIIVALLTAVLTIIAFNYKKLNILKVLNDGASSSISPIFNTAAIIGYGNVINALPGFNVIRETIVNSVPNDPATSSTLVTSLLSAITGSASGGISITLDSLGATYCKMAAELNVNPELLHRLVAIASSTLDVMPHNGAVITLLAICGLKHKEAYKDICAVALVVPSIAAVFAIVLSKMFGCF